MLPDTNHRITFRGFDGFFIDGPNGEERVSGIDPSSNIVDRFQTVILDTVRQRAKKGVLNVVVDFIKEADRYNVDLNLDELAEEDLPGAVSEVFAPARAAYARYERETYDKHHAKVMSVLGDEEMRLRERFESLDTLEPIAVLRFLVDLGNALGSESGIQALSEILSVDDPQGAILKRLKSRFPYQYKDLQGKSSEEMRSNLGLVIARYLFDLRDNGGPWFSVLYDSILGAGEVSKALE